MRRISTEDVATYTDLLTQHGSTEATEPCDDGYEPLAVAFQQEQCEEATQSATHPATAATWFPLDLER